MVLLLVTQLFESGTKGIMHQHRTHHAEANEPSIGQNLPWRAGPARRRRGADEEVEGRRGRAAG